MVKTIYGSEMSDIFSEVVERVHNLYGHHLKEVLLYGSYAKGEADDESDIDIMVLIDADEEEKRAYDDELTKVASDIGYKHMKVIALMDINYNQFNEWSTVLPFYKNVMNEGVVLYG